MKFQSYDNFWQRIHKSAKDKGFPLRVMFELTYRCNFRCRHCYVPQSYREYRELKTKEVFSILGQLRDIGCFYLGFTGGEPFVREDIMDILRHAKNLGFEIIIYTNGLLINEKTAKELAHLQPNKVDITIPAMSKDAFEQITMVDGSRDKVFKAVALLRKNGVNLGFKTCVLKESEDEIKDIQDFASSLGALHRLDDVLSARLDGSREPYEYRGRLKETPHAARRTLHAARCTPHAARFKLHADCDLDDAGGLFKCGVGVSQAAITPFGELKMCLMIDYPKYKINTLQAARCRPHAQSSTPQAHSLKDTWDKLKELVKNIKPDENYQCNKCELVSMCKWCPGKAWLYNKTFTSCEQESRRKAGLIRELLNC